MAESETEVSSTNEEIYTELQSIPSETLFCSRCSRYFASKSQFSQHVKEHINENMNDRETYMCYIENYVCPCCSKQFEVKSDLIIHYNTVCFDAAYTCKHCREICADAVFLQMHLLFHHNYSQEMLRDEGFFTGTDNIQISPECPIVKSSRRKAFESISPPPPTEDTEEFFATDNSATSKPLFTITKLRRNKRKRENVANSVTKSHICDICSESFSRKCVLDIHVQKHTLLPKKDKRMNRDISQNVSSINFSENSYNSEKNVMQDIKNCDTSEVPDQQANNPCMNLKQDNSVLGSYAWKLFHNKRKFRNVKFPGSTRGGIRRNKVTDALKCQYSIKLNTLSRLLNAEANLSDWKKIKHISKIHIPNTAASCAQSEEDEEKEFKSTCPTVEASNERTCSESTTKKIKRGRKKNRTAGLDEEKYPETTKKIIKRRKKLQNSKITAEQEDPKFSKEQTMHRMKTKSVSSSDELKNPKASNEQINIRSKIHEVAESIDPEDTNASTKKIKHRRKIQIVTVANKNKDPEAANERFKCKLKIQNIGKSIKSKDPGTSKKGIKGRRKIQNITTTDNQKDEKIIKNAGKKSKLKIRAFKIKHGSSIPHMEATDEHNGGENTKKKIKSICSNFESSDEKKISENPTRKIKRRKKIQNVADSGTKKYLETGNKVIKRRKKYQSVTVYSKQKDIKFSKKKIIPSIKTQNVADFVEPEDPENSNEKIKCRSIIQNVAVSNESKDRKSSNEQIKCSIKLENIASSAEPKDPGVSKKKFKYRRKVQNATASGKQKDQTSTKKNKRKAKIQNVTESNELVDSKISNTATNSSETEQQEKETKNEQSQIFICKYCNKEFTDSYKLKRHSLIHTGERPYSCPKCNLTFARNDHMKRHFKRVCSKNKNSKLKISTKNF